MIAFVFPLFVSGSYGQNQASATPPANDAIVHHMEELEEQVKDLRAEVAALKETDKTTMTTGSAPVAMPQSNLVSSATVASTPAAPSLAGLLGSTSLSGFVDVYYGQNFNNPASQTNGLRFFDQSTRIVWPEHGRTGTWTRLPKSPTAAPVITSP